MDDVCTPLNKRIIHARGPTMMEAWNPLWTDSDVSGHK